MSAVSLPPVPVDDAERRVIRAALDRTVFVEAGAGAGKTRELVERIVALVTSGVPIGAIAAITFTEKAAAELRDRVRGALEATASTDPQGRVASAIDSLDEAHFQTLHAFAQSILAAHAPAAGLPPVIEVIDETEAAIDFDRRWAEFLDDFLSGADDPALVAAAWSLGVTVGPLRELAARFHDHWDLLRTLPAWMEPASWPPAIAPAAADVAAAADRAVGAADRCTAAGDPLRVSIDTVVRAYRDRLRAAIDSGEVVALVEALTASLKVNGNAGRAANWPGGGKPAAHAAIHALREAADDLHGSIALPAMAAVARRLRDWTLKAAAERRRSGRLEFHDLLVLTRDLLVGDERARRAVAGEITHLLVDEFQDTDPLQVDLALALAAADSGAPRAGSLFFVGDPKQSIYRFRRADMAVYRSVRDDFAGDRIGLATNFRSVAGVLDWVNAVFGTVLAPLPDGAGSSDGADSPRPGTQAPWAPLAPWRPDAGGPAPVVVLGGPVSGPTRLADVRAREAADVARVCGQAVDEAWPIGEEGRPARPDDIAILLPTRSSLPAIERALDDAGIAYRVESRSLLWSTQEIRDLLSFLRGVDDPSDEVAIVAALRSPLLACDDPSLVDWHDAGGSWDLTQPAPQALGGDHPVGRSMATLRAWHGRRWELDPAELVAAVVAERNALALAYGRARPRETWHRVRFLVDAARSFADRGGSSLREFLDWAERQAEEGATAVEAIVPEHDDRAVRILTVHAAKGLEFGVCIVAGLNAVRASWRPATVLWGSRDVEIRLGKIADHLETPGFAALRTTESRLEAEEQDRLLYVACTRARDHLVVSMWHKYEAHPKELSCAAARALAAVAGAGARHRRLDGSAVDLSPRPLEGFPEPAPYRRAVGEAPAADPEAETVDVEVWVRERDAMIGGAVRPVVSATAVAERARTAGVAAHPPEPAGPGGAGRAAAAAFGRAVHAALELVDGPGDPALADLCARSADREGIAARSSEVEERVYAALSAPAVREAWASDRRWREVAVGAEVAGAVVEGFVDLLYERDGELVIVDYKTDAVDPDRIDARVAEHRTQLAAYASVLARALGRPVRRAVLVFCCADGVVEREVDGLEAAVSALVVR